jgi:hypothetical protein
VAHAARAVGVLVAETHFIARRLHHAHLRPVDLEFFRDDHRQAGAYALTHFRAVAYDANNAVLADGDECQRAVDRAMWHGVGAEGGKLVGPGNARRSGGEHQAAERRCALYELSPVDPRCCKSVVVC